MLRRLWLALTTVVIASLLASTAAIAQRSHSQTHKKTFTFYLIPGISTDAFYTTMHKGAQAAANRLGVKLIFQGAPNAFSAPTQTPFLTGAIARHPDAILIAPTDKVAMIAPLRRAVQAHIPVITVDTYINAPLAVTNISSDNVAGGTKAAVALANAVGQKGSVAALSVQPGVSTTDQRQQGFEAKIKQYPKIKYLGTQYDNDSPTVAASKTSALLTAHSDLAGIFALNTNSGIGVTNAAQHSGKKVKLVEFDAEPVEVQALRQGTIDALIAQDPYRIGNLGVSLAYRYVTGQRAGIAKHYGTGEKIITRANVNKPGTKEFLYTK
ncbi:MAG: ABC transporter substrate-binding protein [Chloroflexota bacterium]